MKFAIKFFMSALIVCCIAELCWIVLYPQMNSIRSIFFGFVFVILIGYVLQFVFHYLFWLIDYWMLPKQSYVYKYKGTKHKIY